MEHSFKDRKEKIELANWKRRDHFHFFKDFVQPYWGVSVNINCTKAYQYCKGYGVSFFAYYLYHSLQAANSIKELRDRIEDGEVYNYQNISGSVTVLRNNHTFGFAYFEHADRFSVFSRNLKDALQSTRITNGLKPSPGIYNLIHYSVLPGIAFTSIQHAQHLSFQDSVPKIVFGKYHEIDNQLFLPVSVHVHHALCDGIHIESFFKEFAKRMELNR